MSGDSGREAPVWMSGEATYGWQCGYDAAQDEKERLRTALDHHFTTASDPCQDRGVEWPCDVARAFGVHDDGREVDR